MKRVTGIKLFSVITLAAILAFGTIYAVMAEKVDISERSKFNVNENGQTYGSSSVDSHLATPETYCELELPELIMAMGVDGTVGYVYQSELERYSHGGLPAPTNPEEALEYMIKIEELKEAARISGKKHLNYIPLYDVDGKTIIGKFGVISVQ